MAGKEDNDAMIVGIAAILKQQAEDNQAQMRELLKTHQEMMTQAQAPLAEAVRTVDVRPQQGLSEATVPRFDKILSTDAFIKRLRDWFEDQNHTSESIRMNLIINTMMENKKEMILDSGLSKTSRKTRVKFVLAKYYKDSEMTA